jgi:hypothetical protein
MFRGGGFVHVYMSFKPSDFNMLATVFKARYGPPTSETGNDNLNRKLTWIGPNVVIDMRYLLSEMTVGTATLVTTGEIRESLRLREEQTKDAAKGL